MVSLNIIIFCQKNIVSLSASVLQGYEQLKYSSAWIWTSISATFQWPACLCFITVTPGTLMTKGFKCHCLPAYPNFCMFSPVQLSRSCRSYIQLPRFHVIPFFVKKSLWFSLPALEKKRHTSMGYFCCESKFHSHH